MKCPCEKQTSNVEVTENFKEPKTEDGTNPYGEGVEVAKAKCNDCDLTWEHVRTQEGSK